MKLPSFPPGYVYIGLFFGLTLLVLGGVGLLIFLSTHPRTIPAAVVLFPAALTLEPASLEARAAIVYDPSNNRILFTKNSNQQLPLASLTKLMVAEVVLEKKSPAMLVSITPDDLRPEGDWGLRAGDMVSLGDLLKFGLVASSNDAMAAAARALGSNYLADMNLAAVNLGFTQTYFLNPTGLDINQTISGGYGSAYDVARLTALFYKRHPGFFEDTSAASVSIHASGRLLTSHATALPLFAIPGFAGAKTGYTDLAGGNLAVVFDAEVGRPLVAVVLGSTEEGRFSDIKKLITAARLPAQAGADATSTTP
ncbi:MAG: serine hydrolase [bacterium]|nr:serine hydrolase [bacterium]